MKSLTLREYVAREMFADYKLRQSYWGKERSRKEWDQGTAFASRYSKDPWLFRADAAIEAYESWHKGE